MVTIKWLLIIILEFCLLLMQYNNIINYYVNKALLFTYLSSYSNLTFITDDEVICQHLDYLTNWTNSNSALYVDFLFSSHISGCSDKASQGIWQNGNKKEYESEESTYRLRNEWKGPQTGRLGE